MVFLKDINDRVDLWRKERGATVFPAVSKDKVSYENRDEYYHKPVPEEIHEKWKRAGRFVSGLAVSPGKTWGVPDLDGYYLTCFEWDKIQGFNVLFPCKTVEEVAQEEYIEWHTDAKEKGHLWFFAPFAIAKKEPDTVLGIEIKSQHEHGIMMSSPSIHKDGMPYEVAGIDVVKKWDEDQVVAAFRIIEDGCEEHGVEYLKQYKKGTNSSYNNTTNNTNPNRGLNRDFDFDIGFVDDKNDPDAELKVRMQRMVTTFPIVIDDSIEIPDGRRHNVLIFTANSILSRHGRIVSHDKLKEAFFEIAKRLCKPDEGSVNKLDGIWNSSMEFQQLQAQIKSEAQTIPEEILKRLNQLGVFKIVSENPTTIYLADRFRNQILKAYIMKPKTLKEVEQSEDDDKDTDTKTKTKTEKTTTTKGKKILIKHTMIDAIPVEVTVFSNPMDLTRTYKVKFRHKNTNGAGRFHYTTVGPGTVSYLLQELKTKGRYVKGRESDEALTSILIGFEDLGIATINNRMPQPGYYMIEGKVKGFEVTQNIGIGLDRLIAESKDEIEECTEILDGLVTKYKNPDIGPTIIKHGIISAFGYIKKELQSSGDNWIPGLFCYGFTRAGKNTAGIISLAIWRKHTFKDKGHHQLGFGSIDTPARFGNAVSYSTYEVMISEVASIKDKRNQWLSEMVKHSVENETARGRYEEGFFKGVPALSVPILTSNFVPPSDPAFWVRFVLLHFGKNDLPSEEEKISFKKWLFEEKRIDKLGILGDFSANYLGANPEVLNLYWEDIAKRILGAFYAAANKSPPYWIDRFVEQDQLAAHVEEGKLKIRAFFIRAIHDAYDRYVRNVTEIGQPILPNKIAERLEFCLEYELITFLALHRSQRTSYVGEVVITPDVLDELTERVKVDSLTSLGDLASMLGEGFTYCNRRLAGGQTRVVAGSPAKFKEFLQRKIRDEEEEEFTFSNDTDKNEDGGIS